MLVDPAPDALVRDPASDLVIVPGTDVDENDPYWARLIVDGDLVASPTPALPIPRAAPIAANKEGDN